MMVTTVSRSRRALIAVVVVGVVSALGYAVYQFRWSVLGWVSDRACALSGCADYPTGYLLAFGAAGSMALALWLGQRGFAAWRRAALWRAWVMIGVAVALFIATLISVGLPKNAELDDVVVGVFPHLAPMGVAAMVTIGLGAGVSRLRPLVTAMATLRPARAAACFAAVCTGVAAVAALVGVELMGGYRTGWSVGGTDSYAPEYAGWQRIERDSVAFEVPPGWAIGPQTVEGDIYPLAEHPARCGPIAVGTAFLARRERDVWWGEAVDAAAARTLGAGGHWDPKFTGAGARHLTARLRVPGCPHDLVLYTRPVVSTEDAELWLVVTGTTRGDDAPPDRDLRRAAFDS